MPSLSSRDRCAGAESRGTFSLARQRDIPSRGIHRRGVRIRGDAAGGGTRGAAYLRRTARRAARFPGLRHLFHAAHDVLERAFPLSPALWIQEKDILKL